MSYTGADSTDVNNGGLIHPEARMKLRADERQARADVISSFIQADRIPTKQSISDYTHFILTGEW